MLNQKEKDCKKNKIYNVDIWQLSLKTTKTLEVFPINIFGIGPLMTRRRGIWNLSLFSWILFESK